MARTPGKLFPSSRAFFVTELEGRLRAEDALSRDAPASANATSLATSESVQNLVIDRFAMACW
jgi:hypothetical protein